MGRDGSGLDMLCWHLVQCSACILATSGLVQSLSHVRHQQETMRQLVHWVQATTGRLVCTASCRSQCSMCGCSTVSLLRKLNKLSLHVTCTGVE